jgi:hypothetical protein
VIKKLSIRILTMQNRILAMLFRMDLMSSLLLMGDLDFDALAQRAAIRTDFMSTVDNCLVLNTLNEDLYSETKTRFTVGFTDVDFGMDLGVLRGFLECRVSRFGRGDLKRAEETRSVARGKELFWVMTITSSTEWLRVTELKI